MRTLFRTIVIVLLGGCFFSSFVVSAQENYEVRQLNFHGNVTLDNDMLLEAMAIKEVSYLEKLITKQQPSLFSRELIELDVQRGTRLYQSEGFSDVVVTLRPFKVNDKKKNVKITMEIEEGDPVKVDSISVRTVGAITKIDMDSLVRKTSRKLELTKGIRFRDASLNTDLQQITDACRNLGYA